MAAESNHHKFGGLKCIDSLCSGSLESESGISGLTWRCQQDTVPLEAWGEGDSFLLSASSVAAAFFGSGPVPCVPSCITASPAYVTSPSTSLRRTPVMALGSIQIMLDNLPISASLTQSHLQRPFSGPQVPGVSIQVSLGGHFQSATVSHMGSELEPQTLCGQLLKPALALTSWVTR